MLIARLSYYLMMLLLLLSVVAITGTHFSNTCWTKHPKSLLESVFSYVPHFFNSKTKPTPPVRENPVSATADVPSDIKIHQKSNLVVLQKCTTMFTQNNIYLSRTICENSSQIMVSIH